jgi:hypothetical protein
MIPLVLLALGIGVALTAYETSARVRSCADDYVRAIRGAHAAHRAADFHLSDVNVAAVVAAQHAQAAASVQHAAQVVPAAQHAQTAAAAAQASAPLPPPVPMPVPMPPAQALADAHAEASQIAIDVGVDRTVAAMEANQAAAQSTADAAKSAKTADERIAAAQSAARVLAREKVIAAALVNFGIGQCGIHAYAHVSARVTDLLLTRLHEEGMIVTGDNPWNIETHQYDVKLRAIWDPKGQTLKLIVTAGKGGYAGLVTCDEIWGKIDPIVKGLISA